MRYDTILLDADGTLMDFHRSEREAVDEALRAIGLVPDEETLSAYSRINDSLWKKLEKGEIEKTTLFYHRFELLAETCGFSADPHALAADYMERLSHKGYLLAGARELCESLQQYARLYIVTNGTGFIQRGRWAVCGLLPCFRDLLISDELGAEKPHVRFFERAAERIPDFRKEKTLIVGDSLTSDMQGGINFGMDTCWYNPEKKPLPEAFRGRITYVAGSYEDVLRCAVGAEEKEG